MIIRLTFHKDQQLMMKQSIPIMVVLVSKNTSVHQKSLLSQPNELTLLSHLRRPFLVSILFVNLILNIFLVLICIVQGFVMNKVQLDDTTQLMVLIPTTVLLLVLAYCISRQPQSSAELAFSVSHFR